MPGGDFQRGRTFSLTSKVEYDSVAIISLRKFGRGWSANVNGGGYVEVDSVAKDFVFSTVSSPTNPFKGHLFELVVYDAYLDDWVGKYGSGGY